MHSYSTTATHMIPGSSPRFRTAFLVLAAAPLLVGCGSATTNPGVGVQSDQDLSNEVYAFLEDVRVEEQGDNVVVLTTSKGMIAIEMRNAKAPITTAAVEKLVRSGFYNGLSFHRVERKFLIQTGDPTGGTARNTGAPKIPVLEVNADLTNNRRGAVGMARPEDQPDGADSQFYILLDGRPSLDGRYAVFGQVLKGLDVAEKIIQGDRISEAYVVSGVQPIPSTPSTIPAT